MPSFFNLFCEWTAAVWWQHQVFLSLPFYSCREPLGVWSRCIPSCHWRGWLMFRECSSGWCLLLPLHVSTWHVPSGKHIHNWRAGLHCLPEWLTTSMARNLTGWVDILLSDGVFGWITVCSWWRKQLTAIILDPDVTHVTGGSSITQRAALSGRYFYTLRPNLF